MMVPGSSPISANFLNFLIIYFCAPIHEDYGQTELSASSWVTSTSYPTARHVGIPISCFRIKIRDTHEMNYLYTDENPRGKICYQGNSIFKNISIMMKNLKKP